MGVKVSLELLKWTYRYGVFTYKTATKTGIVYIPRELLKDEINRHSHVIFSPKKETPNES